MQRAILVGLLLFAATLNSAPFVAFAEESELSAAIRTAIMQDPRASHMTQAQINAMVAALSKEAAQKGVTAYDITWHPSESVVQPISTDDCGSMPGFICTVNHAFGFDGSNMTILLGLFISSGLLAFLLWELWHHHRAAELALHPQR